MTEALVKAENTAVQSYSFADIQNIGKVIADSGLFGVKSPQQAIALCMIAQAEGQHPALAAQEYDIIQGKPALKAKALLARFQNAGGTVSWDKYDDDEVTGTFSHPQGGSITITWDNDRAEQAGLLGKDNWKKWPRQMKRARCISEAVTTILPGCSSFYVPEEVMDFDAPININDEVEIINDPEPEPEPKPTKKKVIKKKAAKKKVQPEPEPEPEPDEDEQEPEEAQVEQVEEEEETEEEVSFALMDDDRKKQMIGVFSDLGVSQKLIEGVLGAHYAEWHEGHRKFLIEQYHKLEEGDMDAKKFASLGYDA